MKRVYDVNYPLTVATLTITDISGHSGNLDRPCSGDTVVYTCTVSGTTLVWNIPGVLQDAETYIAGFSGTFVGAVRSDPATRCELNLTAIGADSLTVDWSVHA